jgi:hypothetical protein
MQMGAAERPTLPLSSLTAKSSHNQKLYCQDSGCAGSYYIFDTGYINSMVYMRNEGCKEIREIGT